MDKVISEDTGAFYQHYPKVATIVTAQASGRDNAMAVAWHASISFKPPLYGVSIAPKRFTYQLIADSKEFGVNFLPFAEAELVAAVGGSGGSVEAAQWEERNINPAPRDINIPGNHL